MINRFSSHIYYLIFTISDRATAEPVPELSLASIFTFYIMAPREQLVDSKAVVRPSVAKGHFEESHV